MPFSFVLIELAWIGLLFVYMVITYINLIPTVIHSESLFRAVAPNLLVVTKQKGCKINRWSHHKIKRMGK